MFGYVKPVTEELLVKDQSFYRATYCGICRELRRQMGQLSGLTLSYDSVFLALVRMAFVEDKSIDSVPHTCPVHPLKKRDMIVPNEAISYTARVFSALAYHKLVDDLEDDRAGRRLSASALKPVLAKARRRAALGELDRVIEDNLNKIRELEREGCESVDECAEPFGVLLGEIFAHGLSGSDARILYALGYHLGRFIYTADAAEDYGEDVRLGRFNPYAKRYGGAPLDREKRQSIETALCLTALEAERAMNLIDFGKKATLYRIVSNTVCLGLKKRIEFLKEGES